MLDLRTSHWRFPFMGLRPNSDESVKGPYRMRVLTIISNPPSPATTGAKVRNLQLWPHVAQSVQLMILGLDQSGNAEHPVKTFPTLSEEYFRYDRPGFAQRAWSAINYSHLQRPGSQKLVQRIREVVRVWRPDLVHAEELKMARFVMEALGKSARPKTSVTFHNVESSLLRATGSSPVRWGAALIDHVHLKNLRHFEKQVAEYFSVCFAYSTTDCAQYKELLPRGHWEVTRNGARIKDVTPAPQVTDRRILLVGSLAYLPNIKGLFWFLDEVVPRLAKDIEIIVAGSHATAEVRGRLAQLPNLFFHDTPQDLTPLYHQAALAVVPVFDGSGTRGKVLEALSEGRAMVSTSKGTEGLGLAENQGALIANTPQDFADKIHLLLDQPKLRQEIAAIGRAQIAQKFDWSTVADDLVEAWKKCE